MSGSVLLVSPPYRHTPGPLGMIPPLLDPPLGLAYLAAALRRAGVGAPVEILDAPALGMSVVPTAAEIVARRPRWVGFSTTTHTAPAVQELCRGVRGALPGCRTVVGGPHPTVLPADLLPDAEYAVLGEGEETLVELVEGADPETVAGLAWMDRGRPVINRRRELIPDLDLLAPPAWDLLPIHRYRYPYPISGPKGHYASLITSRGCPGECTFCATGTIWGSSVRRHSVARVMADLTALVEEHGASLVYFYDDTLVHDRERLARLCGEIRRSQLDFSWICQARADQLDLELCRMLAGSGCRQIEIGVESGDVGVMSAVNKELDPRQVKSAFRAAAAAGMETKANFIFGLPGETLESMRRTTELALELQPTWASFFNFVPFPGTPLFDEYRLRGWMATMEWGRYAYHGEPVVSLPGASTAELRQARRRALAAFYLNPAHLMRQGRRLLDTEERRALWRGGAALLNGVVV